MGQRLLLRRRRRRGHIVAGRVAGEVVAVDVDLGSRGGAHNSHCSKNWVETYAET